MKKLQLLLVAMLMVVGTSFAQVVTVTNPSNVGPTALSATYANLAAAITDLNTKTSITGPVTITLNSGNPQTNPAGGYAINATLSGASNTNRVTIAGSGNTITAPNPAGTSGALNDAIFKVIGSDYITISGFVMNENSSNTTTTAASNNMVEWGVAVLYGGTTNGCQNIIIENNTITLNRTYQNTFGIYSNSTHSATTVTTSATATSTTGGNHDLKIYGNTISNVNNGIVVLGPTAAADHNTGLDIGGSGGSQANTLSNFGTTGTFSGYANVSGTVYGILVRNSKGYNISYNSLTSSNGGVTTATLRGIYSPSATNAPTGTFTNNINYNTISLTIGSATGTLQGIAIEATNASTTSIANINNNNFTALTGSIATSATVTAISTVAPFLTLSISNNTFTNISTNTTGSFTFFGHSYTMPATGSQTLNNNSIVTAFNKTGSGGTVTISSTNGSSPNGSSHSFTNNNFSNITVTGATAITGVTNTDGSSSSPTKTCTGNTFSNWTGGTGSITAISYGYIGATTSSISNNTLSNISCQSSVTGINIGSTFNGATTLNVANNTLSNLTSTGTGSSVTGISCANTSTTININNNSLSTLSSTAAAAVQGIVVSGATVNNIFKNTICNLSGSNASTTVNGILLSASTTGTISNNRIGDLRATAANAANPVNGINITGGTTVNAYFNTVNLNASSSGALFGSSALSASTTPTLTLNNNVLVNNSTTTGAGLAVAYRRSSATLTSYASTSDRNDMYASTIYTDGTTPQVTMAAYKTLVSTRDANSISVNPSFLSTTCGDANFLKVSTSVASQLESTAANVSGFTDDFENEVRQGNAGYATQVNGGGTSPDMGADEFDGIPAPVCSGTPTAATVNGASSVCINTGTSLSLSTTYTDLGITYQWASSTVTGGPYTTTLGTGATQTTGNLSVPTYFVCTITCSNSGLSYTTAEKAISINALPSVTISPSTASICQPGGTAVTLTAGGATSYAYSPTTGLTPTTGSPVSANPASATTYTVTGTDANGCSNTATAVISISSRVYLNSISATPTTICSGSTSALNVVAGTTADYTMSSTTFGLLTATGTVTNTATGDDALLNTVTLPFNFSFFGNTYSSILLYSNGYAAFQTGITGSPYVQTIPSTATPDNFIAISHDDLNVNTAGQMSYFTNGTSPNRIFVINYNGVKYYNSAANDGNLTGQVQLFEADGHIEIHVQNSVDPTLSAKSLGIENVGGTLGYSPSTRNNLSYDITTPEAWKFIPSGGSLSYAWTPATGLTPSDIVANPTTPALTTATSYGVTVTSAAGCSATSTINVDIAGTVVCSPITSSNGVTICAGQSTTLTANATIGGTPYVYDWTADPSLSATNIANPVATPTATTTYTVTITDACLTTCSTTITITVNPLPASVTVSGAGTFCSNATITANNGGDGTIYFQGTTSGGVSTATPSSSETITASGTYYFRALSSTGCWGPEGSAVVSIQTPAGITTTPVSVCQNSASSALGATATNCIGYVNSGTTLAGTFAPSTDLTALRPTTSIVNTSTCSFDASITRNYQLVQFQVSVSGTYTFDMTSTDDGMAYITTGSFVPGSCSGGGTWIKGDDDSGPSNDPQLSMSLSAGVVYNLVSTTYSSTSGTSSASYSWTITPPSGGQIMLPVSGNIEWYTAATGGTSIATGASFDPVGAAGSGLANTNTAGTTTYYAACSYSPVCRTSVDYTVTSLSPDIALSTSGNAASTVGSECKTMTQSNSATLTYSSTSCNVIADIADNAAGSGLGSTAVCANVVASNPVGPNGQVYAPRYVQITPSTSEAADVTIYFTQADFTNYNAGNGSLLDFPTSASDPNIANVIVAQVAGGPLATGTITAITPTSVTWDATNSKWSVVFPASALDGYYYAFSNPTCNYNMPASTVSNITSSSAQFDWTSAGSGLTYDWRYRVQGATTWTNAGTGSSAVTRVFTGLLPNTTYEFQGKVRCGAGLSGLFGSTVTFTTAMGPCTTPTGLAYSGLSSNSVTLSWAAMSAPVTSYILRYRIVGSGTWMNAGVATNTKIISGLTPGSNYEAQVASYCSAAGTLTAYSSSVTFTTTIACPVTTNLTYANATSNSIQLNWDAMGSPVTSYVLSYRVVGSGTWSNAGVTTNTKTLYGLTAGTDYEATVKSYCSAGGILTAASNTVTFTTSAGCPLTTNISSSSVTTTQASLIWTDVSSATSGNKYVLRYRVNPSGSWNNAGCPTYFKTIYGLTANTTYDVQVQTVCAGGALSAFTDSYTFATPASKPGDVIEATPETANTFAVYPNPTSDVISVQFYTAMNQTTTIKVYDLTGRLMKQVSRQSLVGNNSMDVNLGEFANGLYTVQVYENNTMTHTTRVRKSN